MPEDGAGDRLWQAAKLGKLQVLQVRVTVFPTDGQLKFLQAPVIARACASSFSFCPVRRARSRGAD
jgi:hypothetical protein